MKWLILTCDATRHIIPAQAYLFDKYVDYPEFEYIYVDLTNEPIATWTENVINKLDELELDDEYVVFGLDDFLPRSPFNNVMFDQALDITRDLGYDRFELGYGCGVRLRMKNQSISRVHKGIKYLEFKSGAQYNVSTQFSIWNIESLYESLDGLNATPWVYEKYGNKAHSACFKGPVFKWIEQSALSGRVPGRINVDGLTRDVLDEMVKLNLLNESKFGIGWGK